MYEKQEEPCEYYFGNVCNGFGGRTICWACGWDMMDHSEFKTDWGSFAEPV